MQLFVYQISCLCVLTMMISTRLIVHYLWHDPLAPGCAAKSMPTEHSSCSHHIALWERHRMLLWCSCLRVLDLMVLDYFLFPLGIGLDLLDYAHVELYWGETTKMSIDYRRVLLLWIVFFLGNWRTDKVVKDGMAIVRLGLGRRVGSTSSWVITATKVGMLRYLM